MTQTTRFVLEIRHTQICQLTSNRRHNSYIPVRSSAACYVFLLYDSLKRSCYVLMSYDSFGGIVTFLHSLTHSREMILFLLSGSLRTTWYVFRSSTHSLTTLRSLGLDSLPKVWNSRLRQTRSHLGVLSIRMTHLASAALLADTVRFAQPVTLLSHGSLSLNGTLGAYGSLTTTRYVQ
jgi:hypothetical protein